MSPDIQESLLSTIQRDCQVLRDFELTGYSLQLGLVLRVSQIVMSMYMYLHVHVAFVSIITFKY